MFLSDFVHRAYAWLVVGSIDGQLNCGNIVGKVEVAVQVNRDVFYGGIIVGYLRGIVLRKDVLRLASVMGVYAL